MSPRCWHRVLLVLLAIALAQGLLQPAIPFRRPSRLAASTGGGFGKAKKTPLPGPPASPATTTTAASSPTAAGALGAKSNKPQPPSPPPQAAFTLQKTGSGKAANEYHLPSFNPSYPGMRCVHSDPPVFEIDDFFTEEECREYQALTEAPGALKMQSQTYSTLSTRTSTTW